MRRPLLLDLYCGAGLTGMGYFLAGFDVIGIDSVPQPEYPFKFIKANVLDVFHRIPWHKVAAIHASPPCKLYTVSRHQSTNHTRQHLNLIPVTRRLLDSTGKPYVIENVPGAPLIDPVTLCGSMFNLHTRNWELKRHRLFELNWQAPSIPAHSCGQRRAISVYGDHCKTTGIKANGKRGTIDMPDGLARQLMGAPWVRNMRQLSQGVPPAYTAFVGYWLRKQI